MPLRTLIVDDHEAVREGLATLFEGTTVTIAAKACSSTEALSQIESLKMNSDGLDVVLLDIQMPHEDGLTTLTKIREQYPELPVVMMSAFDYPVYVARATANGAQDFVFKGDDAVTLIRSLTHAVQFSGPHPDGVLHRVRSKLSETVDTKTLPQSFPLTSREAQVLRHVALGLSNREIAKSLKISVETVKEHVQNILRKTQSNDRTDAAVRAVREGLVD